MTTATPAQPDRQLFRFMRFLRHGLPSVGRYKRYFAIIGPVLGAIWLATAAYLLLVPKSYVSEFTLILPGSGMGSSLNVESIGQAQSSSNSAFASSTLSPTENYKQLMGADITLDAAARIAREDRGAFPQPVVRLVDQTNLIHVSVSGASPEQAKRRADAVRSAFLAQLDILREDEAVSREKSDMAHIEELSRKEQDAQRNLIAFQASHGLATMDQFNARIASVDNLRDKQRETRIQARQHAGTSRRLSGSLNATPRTADVAMRLRGDPLFQKLVERYADVRAQVSEKSGTLGAQHPELARLNSELKELRRAVVQRGRELTGLSEGEILSMVDLQLDGGRSSLMQGMTMSDAQAAGANAALDQIDRDLAQAEAQSPQLIEQASKLAELQREHRVAEAVLSSALARLDTNKQDPFVSYPLVQTLAPPALPREPAGPSWVIALAGALGASLLVLIAFGMMWLRQPILDRILRNA